jgi:hypothetical protein
MVYAPTAYNRSVYAAPPVGGLASIRLGHSATLHSHASFRHIFASPGNLRFPVSGVHNRRKQPERYMNRPAFHTGPAMCGTGSSMNGQPPLPSAGPGMPDYFFFQPFPVPSF